MSAILVLIVGLVTLPAAASAQSWRELYEAGEYSRAAELLHTLVAGAIDDVPVSFPDIEATATLGRLYLEGRGVAQDTMLGCSFIELALIGASIHPHLVPGSVASRITHVHETTCARLLPDDRLDALRMAGCPSFGPHWQTFALAADHVMEISRRGVLVSHEGRERLTPNPDTCGAHVVLVRYARVDPPIEAPWFPPRHFLEWFTWMPRRTDGGPQRVLMWQLQEIVGTSVAGRDGAELALEHGPTWLGGVVGDLGDVAFTMRPDGEVVWRFRQVPLAEALAPLSRAALERESATGFASIGVLVHDQFGAPLAEASVNLRGVVDREMRTNTEGHATFESLPDGRYDVVASAAGLARSVPLVIDISGAAHTPVALALKPPCPCEGPCQGTPVGSGVADIRDLQARLQHAELVLHVRVEEQQGYDAEHWPAPGSAQTSRHIRTSSLGRTLESFKPLAGPVPGSVVIDQAGGRIDRGPCMDSDEPSRLAPLNVGDEYVLFLSRDASGRLTIDGAAEGAFRIRNAWVEPLGAGPLARLWQGRTARSFFDALRLTH